MPICLANDDIAKESMTTQASGFGDKTGACMTNEVGPSTFKYCNSPCQETSPVDVSCNDLFAQAMQVIPESFENITVDTVEMEHGFQCHK